MTCDVSDCTQIDAVFEAVDQRQLGIVVYASGICNQVPDNVEDITPRDV